MSAPPSTLYPPLEPYDSGHLEVGHGHRVYYEQVGNPDGKPALFVHGGPGAGAQRADRRFFDPQRYRAVLFDQRGCGRSTPHASLEHNTTWDLVADMERLREHLGIARWLVFGGSWGSALSLAYAETHPDRTSELVLRGIFLMRRRELLWFYQHGASELFPDLFEDFVAPIPETERGDLISAYHRRLTGSDEGVRLAAAQAWSRWEGATISLLDNPSRVAAFGAERFATAFARIECHYFVHGAFLDSDAWLLENAQRLQDIPGVIVQGRYDVCTPVRSAWDLHRVWPQADLRIVADAGHTSQEPGIAQELIAATDRFAST